nr:MAG TPA: structural protein [Caudoviricetes sp.]
MLNGRRLIKLCDVVAIAEALGVTPNDLFGIPKEKDAG